MKNSTFKKIINSLENGEHVEIFEDNISYLQYIALQEGYGNKGWNFSFYRGVEFAECLDEGDALVIRSIVSPNNEYVVTECFIPLSMSRELTTERKRMEKAGGRYLRYC